MAAGSNSGIYDNPELPFATRASRLLIDLVEVVHDTLFQLIVDDESDNLDLAKLGPALDDLGDASTQIRVKGTIAVTQGAGTKVSRSASKTAGVHVGRGEAALDLGISGTEGRVEEDSIALTREGTEEFYIHLGSLDSAVERVCSALGRSLWLLIDEWSEAIPHELQPVLADMLRRTFMPFPCVTIKIMAIEHRSNFRAPTGRGGYVGLELGADTAETVSLDESLTIGDDATRTTEFVRKLLSEHFVAVARERGNASLAALTSDQVVRSSFSESAFRTLVFASEGNPRDAMNLASKAARGRASARSPRGTCCSPPTSTSGTPSTRTSKATARLRTCSREFSSARSREEGGHSWSPAVTRAGRFTTSSMTSGSYTC